jgi:hypothetical protein
VGINFAHWYAVALSTEVGERPFGTALWQRPIVLFRDAKGQLGAFEDRCPHRQVKLSTGRVVAGEIECAYHGWRFDGSGRCAAAPRFGDGGPPPCRLRRYSVREQDGFVWVWGSGEAPADAPPPLGLPEWDDLRFIGSAVAFECRAHYSFVLENLMDMTHGHLHQDLQAWSDPVLVGLDEDDRGVHAHYQAQSYYTIDGMWSVLQLALPALRRRHPAPLDTSLVYPHWRSTLGSDFRIYCLLCPVHETMTRAWLVHFTSLAKFGGLERAPLAVRRWVKQTFSGTATPLLAGLARQDTAMIEQEQQSYERAPRLRNLEPNPAVLAAQRLLLRQAGRQR